jgi:hypothetical protein
MLGNRQARHDRLERMLLDSGTTVGVVVNLVLQPVDGPELHRVSVRVEQVVDAERGAPAGGERILSFEIQLSEAVSVYLPGGRRSVGARRSSLGRRPTRKMSSRVRAPTEMTLSIEPSGSGSE